MTFRNDIQGLRAIAVILVFIFHLSADLMPGGFVGVDMFFVISGFLVSSIVYNKINKGNFSIIGFYESRLKRIAPAYFFLLIAVALCASFLFINTDILVFRKSLFWTILFNSNNHFSTLDNYFGASSNENPLLHTWTLAVEMQFYFILPIFLMLIRNTKVLIIILSILIFALLIYSTFGIFNGKAGVMYFSLPSRMPEFLIGVVAAITKLENSTWIKRNANLLSLIGLLAILTSSIFYNESTPFPGILSFLPCLGTLAILMSNSSKINNLLSSSTLTYIGEVSYSVYLWHWPIMAFLRYYNNRYEFSLPEKAFVTILTILFALASYYLIEKPLRTSKAFRFYIPFLSIGIAVTAMLILAPKINKNVFGGEIELMSPSFGMTSHGTTFKKVGILGDTTHTYKDKILLLGDSHALSMKKYVDIIGCRNNFSVRTITNNVYPTIPGLDKQYIKNTGHLEDYNKLIVHVNKELESTKLIILQFTSTGERWLTPIRNMIGNLKEHQKILFIEDFPILDKNPVRLNRSLVKNKQIDQLYTLETSILHPDILELINSNRNCKYLRLTKNAFKNAPFYNDTLMYYDRSHLNVFGAKVYALDTEREFMSAIAWGLEK